MDKSLLRPFEEILEQHKADAEFRQRWERTTLGRAVALKLIAHRSKNGLSQSQLAKTLGWKQPALARLESGTHNPTIDTLYHISRTLRIAFLVDIGPTPRRNSWLTAGVKRADVTQQFTSDGSRIFVAAE